MLDILMTKGTRHACLISSLGTTPWYQLGLVEGRFKEKIVNFGKFSDKKFRTGLFLLCLSYLKAGLLGCIIKHLG